MGRYRDQRITVRLTEEEKEILYRQMKRAGNRNVSDFIMTAACTHQSTVIDTSPIFEIKGELSRIGNNVNQIAKVANTTHSIFAEDVEKLKGDLNEARKAEINKCFGLLNKDPKDQFNRYIAVENINTRIKMMNYMSEHNIKSQEDLLSKIETAERHKASIEKEMNWLNAKLDREQSLVTARYYYRKNKDIYRRYEAITDPKQKEIFKTENSREINRYMCAIAIMNHEKEKHGTLPTTKERKMDIEKTKQQISKYKEMLKETQSELSQLEILYENLYDMAHPTEYEYEEEVEEDWEEEYKGPVRDRNRGWER